MNIDTIMPELEIREKLKSIIIAACPNIEVNTENCDGKDQTVLIENYKTMPDGKIIAYINNQGIDINEYNADGSILQFVRNYQITLISARNDLSEIIDEIIFYFITHGGSMRDKEDTINKLVSNVNTRFQNILYSTLTFEIFCY
jgi:hypothetical protein